MENDLINQGYPSWPNFLLGISHVGYFLPGVEANGSFSQDVFYISTSDCDLCVVIMAIIFRKGGGIAY